MRREPDAPLRQIEPELKPHRPRQPGIGASLRRPYALDQSAEHDAIHVNEPRLDGAEDAHPRARPARAAADAIRDRGLEQVHVIAGRCTQFDALLGDRLECARKLRAIVAGECHVVGTIVRQVT